MLCATITTDGSSEFGLGKRLGFLTHISNMVLGRLSMGFTDGFRDRIDIEAWCLSLLRRLARSSNLNACCIALAGTEDVCPAQWRGDPKVHTHTHTQSYMPLTTKRDFKQYSAAHIWGLHNTEVSIRTQRILSLKTRGSTKPGLSTTENANTLAADMVASLVRNPQEW